MRSLLLLLIAASIILPETHAQERRDDLTPLRIEYTLALKSDRATLAVTLDVHDVTQPRLHFAIPEWPPGSYSLRGYAEWIDGFRATNGETELDVTTMDTRSWSVATAGARQVRITYEIPDHERRYGGTPPEEPRTGMHFEGPETFVYVKGQESTPVTVRYQLPKEWEVANGLLGTDDPMVRRAPSYDMFIDCPTIIGRFLRKTFDVEGTRFDCVFLTQSQKYDFDADATVDTIRKIVTSQGKLFGSFPFHRYVFLFTEGGGGGLEHLSSTSIGYNERSLRRNPASIASIVAHEYFHTWNVKRIRPKELGPFEYHHEVYTSSLWVAEGWTSYYGALTLTRLGIRSEDSFLAALRGLASGELNTLAGDFQSVMRASRTVWHRDPNAPRPVNYYGKGQLLATLIDLKIRHETENRKSLDDVMRFLNRWFAQRNVGYEEGDIERACTAISNYDFSEFFARHVAGTARPPFAEIVGYAGIDCEETETTVTALPFFVRDASNGLEVYNQPGLNRLGLRGSDVITTINGEPASGGRDAVTKMTAGESVELGVARGGRSVKVHATLTTRTTTRPKLSWSPNPTPLQQSIRKSWLGQE